MTAPLVGSQSVFGDRPGGEGPRTDGSRTMKGFSPAPGFRFDVALGQRDRGVFVVSFTQPDRRVPYLQGDLVWVITEDGDGVAFEEQINTDWAMEVAGQPLGGPRPSLRRWLFFRAGHKQVMAKATVNLAGLAG